MAKHNCIYCGKKLTAMDRNYSKVKCLTCYTHEVLAFKEHLEQCPSWAVEKKEEQMDILNKVIPILLEASGIKA